MAKKIFKIKSEAYSVLSEMIDVDGKIVSGDFPIKSGETSINSPNEEGYPPPTTDVHMNQSTQPQTAFRYGAFWIAGGISESTIREEVLTTNTGKSQDLVQKSLSKEEVQNTFPLTKPLFDQLNGLVQNINIISTETYNDNVEQIKVTFIKEFLKQINYNVLSSKNKKLIFNNKSNG